jgi:chromate transport protein ChrA
MGAVLRKFLWAGLTAFGAARWTTLEDAFVRGGLIDEKTFFRDYAVSSTLPGPTFVNLAALCGMRLGGVRVALAAIVLLLAPGLAAVILVLVFLNPTEPWVRHLFNGILVGAVGVVAAQYVRRARRMSGLVDASIAAATLVLIAVGAPMYAAVLGVLALGVLWYRNRPLSLP